jgi:rod shape-determining protein MreC
LKTIKKFIKNNTKKLIVMAVILVFIVTMSLIFTRKKASFGANSAEALSASSQRTSNALISWLEELYGSIYRYDKVVAENEALKDDLVEAEYDSIELADTQAENERLRQLLEFGEEHTDFTFESAKIIAWTSSNWSSTFMISKGTDNDINVGDCIVTESGVLVGQVIEAGKTWASVRTVIDVDTNIGALVGASSTPGMTMGNFQLMQKGCTMLTYLSDSSKMKVGNNVVTSGSVDTIPPGLLIGKVSDIVSEAGGQNVYGVVEPSCDLDSLTQVFAITDFEIVE